MVAQCFNVPIPYVYNCIHKGTCLIVCVCVFAVHMVHIVCLSIYHYRILAVNLFIVDLSTLQNFCVITAIISCYKINYAKEEIMYFTRRRNIENFQFISVIHLECTHLLLAHGAPVKVKNLDGWSPLAEAISYGDRQTSK